MAYNGPYEPSARPYAGAAAQRPTAQRQYPPGPGGGGGGAAPPPQQYDQYQDDYGYQYDDYGNGGYDQGYGDDMNYQRGPPQGRDFPPQQDNYGPGPGRGRGRPMRGGRGGGLPPGPGQMQRAPTGDGPRGPYPPRGGRGGYPPNGRGGRPAPLERQGNSDPGDRRNGPPLQSPPAGGFGGSPFPAFPGHSRTTDLQEEGQILDRMEGLDLGPQQQQRRGPPMGGRGGAPMRGPPGDGYGGRPSVDSQRGPPRPYPPQGYPEQRRGPPGPGYGPQGGYDDGYGPERSMTMPAREHYDAAPPRQGSLPYNGPPGRGGMGMPQRPNTAQGMRQGPQRAYPPNNAPPGPGGQYRDDGASDSGYSSQQRPASFDDFYDYYDGRASSEYPQRNPSSAGSEMPNFDAAPPQGHRNSLDQHMQPPSGAPLPQQGAQRVPDLSRTKSQPDLRHSQEAVFEMAGDIPPMPSQYQGQQPGLPPNMGYDNQPGYGQGPPLQQRPGPAPGLPNGPAPYRAGAQSGPPSNPDSLPSHPTPVRPGLMPNSLVSLANKPPPVRNYGGNTAVAPQPVQSNGPPPQQGMPVPGGPGPLPAKVPEQPVTIEELERLRAMIKADSNDQGSALRLAKRLLEAADVLVPQLPDPKSRARSRERYVLDAQKILKKLANAGNPDAMFVMADGLGRGIFGGEPDNKEAFTLYQSAAKLGNAAAAYRTAVCCEIGNEEGGGTRKDPLKAIQWYKRAATLGDTPAMYKVGMILLKGLLGQPRNPREAVGWLKRASERADAENPHALHELGLLYESAQPNDAIIRDEPYAFSLFKQAADLGYKFSQFRLGCAFEYGLMGCPIDPRLSIMWYSRAATQEEHQSELALSGWYLTGSDGVLQQSDTEAYLWARKAALAGLAKAEYAMGYFTEVGIGVPANLEDAKRWYWRAAAQDFPKARERLEDLKRSGRSGPRQRERISRSKIAKGQEGECSVM